MSRAHPQANSLYATSYVVNAQSTGRFKGANVQVKYVHRFVDYGELLSRRLVADDLRSLKNNYRRV